MNKSRTKQVQYLLGAPPRRETPENICCSLLHNPGHLIILRWFWNHSYKQQGKTDSTWVYWLLTSQILPGTGGANTGYSRRVQLTSLALVSSGWSLFTDPLWCSLPASSCALHPSRFKARGKEQIPLCRASWESSFDLPGWYQSLLVEFELNSKQKLEMGLRVSQKGKKKKVNFTEITGKDCRKLKVSPLSRCKSLNTPVISCGFSDFWKWKCDLWLI